MNPLIALDGGGTKTDLALFLPDGTVLRRLRAPACNPNDIGWPKTQEVLRQALAELLQGQPVPLALYAGVSGGTTGNNQQLLLELLQGLLPGCAHVGNGSDAVSALSSGMGLADGCVVICGTGSVGFVRQKGRVERLGGWGYLFDKGGSGYDFGRDAVYHALCALDGRGPATCLTALLERELGQPVDLAVTSLYQKGKPAIAALAPLVFEALAQNDPAAQIILRENCQELARLFNALAQKMGQQICPIVLAGSMFRDFEAMRPFWEPMLCHSYQFIRPSLPPVYGSAVEAMSLAGFDPDEAFQKRFAQTIPSTSIQRL